MKFIKEKLLTIITELDLQSQLIEDIDKLGATGYTITSVQGKGEKGVRNALWSPSSNIKVEIICKEDICLSISKYLKDKYINNYAMIIFIDDVETVA